MNELDVIDDWLNHYTQVLEVPNFNPKSFDDLENHMILITFFSRTEYGC